MDIAEDSQQQHRSLINSNLTDGLNSLKDAQTEPVSNLTGTMRREEVNERFNYAKDWIMSASELAKRSGDPEALEIAAFLKDEVSFGVLRDGKVGKIDSQQTYDVVMLVPVLKDDEKLLTKTKNEAFGKNRAITLSGVIFIDAHDESTNTEKGLVLLHEGFHAKCWLNRGKTEDQNSAEYWLEEVEAYRREVNTFTSLGTSGWAQAVDEYAKILGEHHLSGDDVSQRLKELVALSIEKGNTDHQIRDALYGQLMAFAGRIKYYNTISQEPEKDFARWLHSVHARH